MGDDWIFLSLNTTTNRIHTAALDFIYKND